MSHLCTHRRDSVLCPSLPLRPQDRYDLRKMMGIEQRKKIMTPFHPDSLLTMAIHQLLEKINMEWTAPPELRLPKMNHHADMACCQRISGRSAQGRGT